VGKTQQHSPGPHLDEREQRINDDYEWCLRDSTVREKHAGQVVIVHSRTIWGAGKNHAAAWAAAARKRGCPPKDQVAMVVVPDGSAQTAPRE
jgi:hypothetical protein